MSNLKNRLAIMSKEAVNFCPDCKSMMKIPKGSKDNVEYCSNANCEKSFEFEKQQRKEEKERKRDEKINITYDNGKPGDSVLIKFINNANGKEYWSAQERKVTYPDSWVETKINGLQRELDIDDKRLPPEMREDYKSGDTFSVEFEVYESQGAFDHANNQLAELGEKAYHIMKKSPKNPHDPGLDRIMDEDELLVPMASLKRLIKAEEDKEDEDVCEKCGKNIYNCKCYENGDESYCNPEANQ